MLGVSRGTARAAVRSLVDAGLLDVRQGSGTFVMSAQEMSADVKRIRRTGLRNQFEVRRALEVEAARLAATRATSKDIPSLRSLLAKRGDWLGHYTLYLRFLTSHYHFHLDIIQP